MFGRSEQNRLLVLNCGPGLARPAVSGVGLLQSSLLSPHSWFSFLFSPFDEITLLEHKLTLTARAEHNKFLPCPWRILIAANPTLLIMCPALHKTFKHDYIYSLKVCVRAGMWGCQITCGSWLAQGLNSDHQAWQQAPLDAEPRRWPPHQFIFYLFIALNGPVK